MKEILFSTRSAECGTTIAAARKLNRQWIGIDITHLSVGLQKLRLKDSFGLLPVTEKRTGTPSSPKGTNKIAQGKAEGRHPGNKAQIGSDPEGVEQTAAADVAPLQGADHGLDASPGFHPGLLSSSPSATEEATQIAKLNTEPTSSSLSATSDYYQVIGQPEDLDGARELAVNDRYGFVPMQKHGREQGRNAQLGEYALANAQASASEWNAPPPEKMAYQSSTVSGSCRRRSPRVSKGIMLNLAITPSLTRRLLHPIRTLLARKNDVSGHRPAGRPRRKLEF